MAVSVTMRVENPVPADFTMLARVLQAEAERDGHCRSCRVRRTRDALITQQVWLTLSSFAAYRDGAVAEALRALAPRSACFTAAFRVSDGVVPPQPVAAAARAVPEQRAPSAVPSAANAGLLPPG